MAHKVIELPGMKYDLHSSTWRRTSFEAIQITGRPDEPVSVTLVFRNYNHSEDEENDPAPHYFKLIFFDVLEYRYIDEMVSYSDLTFADEGYTPWALVEIFASEYIENMAANGRRGHLPKGQRFGKYNDDPDSGGIAESAVRHFRLRLDKWGQLDVIALNLSFVPAKSV